MIAATWIISKSIRVTKNKSADIGAIDFCVQQILVILVTSIYLKSIV